MHLFLLAKTTRYSWLGAPRAFFDLDAWVTVDPRPIAATIMVELTNMVHTMASPSSQKL